MVEFSVHQNEQDCFGEAGDTNVNHDLMTSFYTSNQNKSRGPAPVSHYLYLGLQCFIYQVQNTICSTFCGLFFNIFLHQGHSLENHLNSGNLPRSLSQETLEKFSRHSVTLYMYQGHRPNCFHQN